MTPLLTAIRTKFNATSALTSAFTGGYWNGLAAEGTAFPYLVSNVIASPTTLKYGGRVFDEPTIRFSAVGIGHDTVSSLIDIFTSTFDELTLTLSTGTNLVTSRFGEAIPSLSPNRDGSGNEVWFWTVIYKFQIQ